MKSYKIKNRNSRRKRKSPNDPSPPPKLDGRRSQAPVRSVELEAHPQESEEKEELRRPGLPWEYSEAWEKYRNEGVNQYTMLALKYMSQHSFAWSQLDVNHIRAKLLHYCLFFHMSELEIAAWSLLCQRGLCGIAQDFDGFLINTALQIKEALGHSEEVKGYFSRAVAERPSIRRSFLEWKKKNPANLELAEVNRRYTECICAIPEVVPDTPHDYNKHVTELLQMTSPRIKEEDKKFQELNTEDFVQIQKDLYTKEESHLEMATKLDLDKIRKDSLEAEIPERLKANISGIEEVEKLYSFENLSREDNLMPHFTRIESAPDFALDDIQFSEFFLQNEPKGSCPSPLPPGDFGPTLSAETPTQQDPHLQN